MSMSTVERPVAAEPKPASTPRFFADFAEQLPIRGELFGLEHLESQARELAAASPVMAGKSAGHPLLRRFVENGRRLTAAHEKIVVATRHQETLAPDAEWLLDNFHIVVDTLREVRHDCQGDPGIGNAGGLPALVIVKIGQSHEIFSCTIQF